MHDALARRDEILRASVEASGGQSQTVGDAFCAPFETRPPSAESTLRPTGPSRRVGRNARISQDCPAHWGGRGAGTVTPSVPL